MSLRILVVLAALTLSPFACGSNDLALSFGITGSTPGEKTQNPTAILATAKAQALVLAVAERPHSRAEAESAIEGEFYTVDDMVATGLLRQEAETYRIDFNLLRVADQRRIFEVTEQLGRDLANAFLERRDELEAIASKSAQRSGLGPEFLYITVGCFALDWDGLDLTAERGWRLGAQRVIDGQAFTPWAKERGADISLKGLYWGSHNNEVGELTVTTFGDHQALPRFGLPDLLWSNSTTFRPYKGVDEELKTAAGMLAAYEIDVLADITRILMAVRSEDLDSARIEAVTGIEERRLAKILAFLEAAQYLRRYDDEWRASVVVIGPEDAELVARTVAIGREIMTQWHETNYERMRAQLSDLTPIRHGVPFERVYTEIWHFVFGIANRVLVEQGMFADPYSPSRRHQGFLPAVWYSSLAAAP